MIDCLFSRPTITLLQSIQGQTCNGCINHDIAIGLCSELPMSIYFMSITYRVSLNVPNLTSSNKNLVHFEQCECVISGQVKALLLQKKSCISFMRTPGDLISMACWSMTGIAFQNWKIKPITYLECFEHNIKLKLLSITISKIIFHINKKNFNLTRNIN